MKKLTALIMLGLMLSSVGGGQIPSAPPAPPTEENQRLLTGNIPAGVRELTAADVETFLDGIVPLQLAQQDVAGATVSIVKDGKLLFAKGYGYSDVKNKKSVSAEETLFRIGSVSKLFTWTAIMQLAEQGKLDLDRDVNEYLDFKIPDAFGQPITLKNILSHTPGFEEQLKDFFAGDGRDPNLGEFVKNHVPKRIYPPGKVPAYSNYATALAGYVVERASGQPFNDYVEANIFRPLGMTRSTFRQPLPPELAALMSNGYKLGSDAPEPFEPISLYPAGSMSSPAVDMSKFMIAHLQNGQFNGAQILKPETAQLMHSRLFALDPAAQNWMAYGFYEESRNDRRIIGHGGDTVLFHSDLHLILDEGVGFFVSYNSAGRGQVSSRTVLFEAFLDRYFPAPIAADAPTTDEESAKTDAAAVSGTYIASRRSDSLFKSLALLSQGSVAPNEDGTISIDALTGTNGKPKRWRRIAPMTFREVDGQDTLVFKPDANGRMQIALPYPFMTFERTELWENSKILTPVLIVSLFVMLLTLLLTPIIWFVRRRYRYRLEFTGWEKLLRLGARLAFALDLFFVVALIGFVLYTVSGHFELLTDSGIVWMRLIQIVGVLGALGTVVVLVNAVVAWGSARYGIWGKLGATVMALACFGFLWFVFAGNLLSFSSNY